MILNTRPIFYRERFHDAFSEIGLPILDSPVLEVEALSDALPNPTSFDALIFTSQIALSQFPSLVDWLHKKVYVVGQATADAARAAGFKDIICTGEDAEDMERCLHKEPFKKGLYASAQDVAKDLAQVFQDRVVRQVVYRMVPVDTLPASVVSKIKEKSTIIVPLFSKRSAIVAGDLFLQAHLIRESTDLHAVGISDDVFATSEGPWHSRTVAPHPTQAAMVATVWDVANRIGLISKVE